MISRSPRIYTYKITFEEVFYYYYGVHLEKTFDEYYMGTPVTHKWMWDFYTPQKTILEFFPYNNEGWIEANKIEKRLIKPVFNIDKWCLNENCGGILSLDALKKGGKLSAKISKIKAQKNKEKKLIEIEKLMVKQQEEWLKEEPQLKLGNSSHAVYQCTITGYKTSPAALSTYQKSRGIDPKNRIRIK